MLSKVTKIKIPIYHEMKTLYKIPMIRTKVKMARIDMELFGMIMEDDVDNVLISPGNFGFILFVNWNNIPFPTKMSHSSQVHQHYSRVNSWDLIVKKETVLVFSLNTRKY